MKPAPSRFACLALVALLAAAACGPDRVAELEAELKRFEADRMPREAVDKARAEADDAERALVSAREALERARSGAGDASAGTKALEAQIAAEALRVDRARAEIAVVQTQTAEAVQATARRDKEIAAAQGRARWVYDQAAVLAREIKPGDAGWATQRRVETLRGFLEKVSAAYPDDPVLSSLAARSRSEGASLDAGSAASAASTVRDRFARIYDLRSPEVATPPPGS